MSTNPRDVDPHEPLAAVLRAASAPGHPEELAGMETAMAAFRVAAPPRRRRKVLTRVLTVKALVVGALAASTGVVLATVSGVLPIPRPEPTLPADPPAVTDTASVPAMPPPDGPESPSGQPDDPSKPAVGPQQGADPPCGSCVPGYDPSKDKPGKAKPGKDGTDAESTPTPPPGEPPPGGPRASSGHPASGRTSRAKTPGSPAHGAATAVPPSGAEPPSQGG